VFRWRQGNSVHLYDQQQMRELIPLSVDDLSKIIICSI